MQLSMTTIELLTASDCQETKKVVDSMNKQAYEHFVKPRVQKKKKPKHKLYFNFRSAGGKIFLETEMRY